MIPKQDDPLAKLQQLNVRQVADLLGVHPRTVWRLVSSGDLPKPIKIGPKIVRWRVADLESYLESLIERPLAPEVRLRYHRNAQ